MKFTKETYWAVVTLNSQGLTYKRICSLLNLGYFTVRRIVRRYRKRDDPLPN